MAVVFVAVMFAASAISSQEESAELRKQVADAIGVWEHRVAATGAFADPVTGYTGVRYGEATIGLGILLTTDDPATSRTQAAINALSWLSSQPHEVPSASDGLIQSVFENFAFAAAYRHAERALSTHSGYLQVRDRWRQWLAGVRWQYVRDRRTDRYRGFTANKSLVETVAALELLAAPDLRSQTGVLGDRDATRRTVLAVINRSLPATARRYAFDAGGRRAVVLSDPPANPPAYHALTAAFYLRALRLMRPQDRSQAARATAAEMVAGIDALASPSGDVAYWGRSQEQSWAVGFAAYAVIESYRLGLVDGRWAVPLARRLLDRGRDVHLGGRHGFFHVPSMRLTGDPVREGATDGYFNLPSYSGLSAVAYAWAAQAAAALPSPGPPVPVLPRRLVVSPAGAGMFATFGNDELWVAVRGRAESDPRYDFGVVLAEARRPDGSWAPVVPHRPAAPSGRTESLDGAGPVLWRHGKRFFAHATEVFADHGRVVMSVDFRRGGQVARRRVRFVFSVEDRRVRMRWRSRRTDRWEFSVYTVSRPYLTAAGVLRADGEYDTQVGGVLRAGVARTEPGWASAVQPALDRTRWTLRSARTGTAALSFVVP